MAPLITLHVKDEQTIQGEPPFQALVVFIHPITIILEDNTPWWPMDRSFIDEGKYEHTMLHEVKLLLRNEHLSKSQEKKTQSRHVPFCFDGAFAIPTDDCFKPIENAVSVFNGILGDILLGGLYCESITAKDICTGSLYGLSEIEKKTTPPRYLFIRIHNANRESPAHLHYKLRVKYASVEDRLDFRNCRQIHASTLRRIIEQGSEIRKNVPQLSPKYLLHGITAMAQHDWTSALASIWIGVEQVTSNIWENRILTRESARHPSEITKDRRDFFNSHDAWTRSLQHELLYQRDVIGDELLIQLNLARKARNALSHRGQAPSREQAKAAYMSFLGLMQVALSDKNKPLIANLERYLQYIREDPYDIPSRSPEPITDLEAANRAWYRAVEPLPGERGLWDKKEPAEPVNIEPSFLSTQDSTKEK